MKHLTEISFQIHQLEKNSTVHGPLASCLGHGPYRYLGVGDPKIWLPYDFKQKQRNGTLFRIGVPKISGFFLLDWWVFFSIFCFFVATWATVDPKSRHFRGKVGRFSTGVALLLEGNGWPLLVLMQWFWAPATLVSLRQRPRNHEIHEPGMIPKTRGIQDWVVVSNIFYVHPYLGKIFNLANIFQMGWNHQLVMIFPWGF